MKTYKEFVENDLLKKCRSAILNNFQFLEDDMKVREFKEIYLDKEKLKQQLSQIQQLCDKYEKEQSTTFKVWLSVIDEHRKLQQEKEELIKYCENEIFSQNKSIELLSNKKYADIHIGAITAYKNILLKLKESDK